MYMVKHVSVIPIFWFINKVVCYLMNATNTLYTHAHTHKHAHSCTKPQITWWHPKTPLRASYTFTVKYLYKSIFFPGGGEKGRVPWNNLFSTTKINPPWEVEKKKKLATAGSAYQCSQVKSVWCTFRFLLQQRRSVSVSDGLNEGLVSRATGSRSTRPGVCVYYQSALVSTAGYIQSSPPPQCLTPHSHTNGHIYRSKPPTPRHSPPPPLCLPQNLSSITPQVLHTYLHTEHTALAPK